ncbi:hypothetical protein KAR91_15990 [Candidatus Pacearchaeota archaeon]|nr:hypothetical protein [Candidatus Pacearchaeota archaeon]
MALKTETVKKLILELEFVRAAVTFRMCDYLQKLLKGNHIKGVERKAFKAAYDSLSSKSFTFDHEQLGYYRASRKLLSQNNWGQAVLEVTRELYVDDSEVFANLKRIQQYW